MVYRIEEIGFCSRHRFASDQRICDANCEDAHGKTNDEDTKRIYEVVSQIEGSMYEKVAHGVSREEWSLSSAEMLAIAERLHPGITLPHMPRSHFPSKTYAHFKRVADVICSAVALIVLSPILLICAIAVRVTSEGPVLFRQERWGRGCRRFVCWKFRTMVIETPADVPAVSFKGKAAYLTPVGDFLRRWSLDELPQLVNILKGDMSVVGPRPVIVREKHLMDLRCPLNADAVRPGLTGWAQVNGRNLVDDEEKAYLDGEYVANMSLGFDTKIFFRTFSVVLARLGIDRTAD